MGYLVWGRCVRTRFELLFYVAKHNLSTPDHCQCWVEVLPIFDITFASRCLTVIIVGET